ncbi:unnamed protein product [Schistosoma margrebowiei]|uniref:Uncharacterized protein n=1 Tax=Schistosoma margrebowiei TaxID=48269 RepID=A0A183MKE1_9TREM|nr:unnamed protein product [Schistosoma margrebowiei]
MPLLTTRATIFIGKWNVRIMWETGRNNQITVELRRYNLVVMGISETYWTRADQRGLDMGDMLLYISHEGKNAPCTRRLTLMLSKQARKVLIGRESHGSKIIKVSLKKGVKHE